MKKHLIFTGMALALSLIACHAAENSSSTSTIEEEEESPLLSEIKKVKLRPVKQEQEAEESRLLQEIKKVKLRKTPTRETQQQKKPQSTHASLMEEIRKGRKLRPTQSLTDEEKSEQKKTDLTPHDALMEEIRKGKKLKPTTLPSNEEKEQIKQENLSPREQLLEDIKKGVALKKTPTPQENTSLGKVIEKQPGTRIPRAYGSQSSLADIMKKMPYRDRQTLNTFLKKISEDLDEIKARANGITPDMIATDRENLANSIDELSDYIASSRGQ